MPKNAERVLNIPDRRRREDKDRHKSDSEREITSVAINVEKEEHFTVLYKSLLFCVGCYSCVSVLRPVLSLCDVDVCTINKQ